MRWKALFASLLVVHNANCQWVRFDACGFKMPEPEQKFTEQYVMRAQNIGPVLVWAPSVTSIIGYTEMGKHKISLHCSHISVGREGVFIVGTTEQIKEALNKVMGD